ncbi:hypothetical protein FRB95_008794 [Tulasnella sp. JGI-2019a]|nr:hypothetical protein FRB95_008794 [Tulasnella sp. JGI-2019a]
MAEAASLAFSDLSSYPTVFDPKTLHRKGLCPVTAIDHKNQQRENPSTSASPLQSHSLYFEIHGNGPEKIILIMGLNASSFGWLPILQYFANVNSADGSDKYSVLVFDNRGVGNSGTPRGPYTTSGMAHDVVILLDYVGWTSPRQIHIVGISLGGMISLELASIIAPHAASLILIVTSAGGYFWNNLAPWKGVSSLARLTFIKEPEKKIPILLPMLYPQAFLDSPAIEYDEPSLTNYEVLKPRVLKRITTTRPQGLMGALSQMYAGLGHYVSPDRLAKISKSIPKVLILTGDQDNLIRPANSHWLAHCMPEAEFVVWKDAGHGILGQRPKEVRELFTRVMLEGRKKSTSESE